MKKRMLAFVLACSMILGMLPEHIALATEGGIESSQTILAVQAGGTLTDDDNLSELAYTDTAFMEATGEGAPSGSVAAAWDKDNLYLGITSANASSVKVELGSKTVDASLVNGVAEVVVSWKEAGVTLWDYNHVIEGLKITLNNDAGSTEMTAGVKITSLVSSDVVLSGMSQYGTKTNMSVTEDQLVWTSETNSTDQVLKLNDTRVDHTKNMLLTQTLKIDELPIGTGEYFGNTAPTENTYYFWISDTVAKGTGSAVWCNVYRVDEDGNLALRVNLDVGNNKSKSGEAVALGRKLGDTFQLALLWNADDSVVVYVDGEKICEVEDATIRATDGWGNKSFRFAYKGSGNKASISLSDAVLSTSGSATIAEELTKNTVLGNVDLTAVTSNLTLPTTYQHEILGEIPLTWSSSNTDVLATDGKVNCPSGTGNQTVQLTLSVNGKQFWTVYVTVLSVEEMITQPMPGLVAVQAGTINDDDVMSEIDWTDTSVIKAGQEGAPTGKVAAAWDKNYLYLGITAKNATSVKVVLGNKAVDADLVNGVGEVVIPWNEAGITLVDYNQVIEDLRITLTGDTTSTLAKGNVTITSLAASDIVLSGMSQYGTKANMSVTEDQLVWTSETNSTDQVLKLNDTRVDHTKNMLLTQTLKIDELPIGTGEYFGNTAPTENTYYFWISDTAAKGTGAAVWCNVYRTDEEGNLALRVNLDAGNNKSKSGESFALGRKLGDTFQLALLWNADDSVVVYVDGEKICEVEDATIRATDGWGNKAFRFAYRGSGNKAIITLTDAVLSTSGLESVTESMTKSAVLGPVDLAAVTDNLNLPMVYVDPVFGQIPLSWTSSDESILATDGTVTRPLGTVSKIVQLSLVAFGKTIWNEDVTVLPAVSGLAVSASCADEIAVDGNVNEKYYTHYEVINASANGAPAGKVSAVYNKNGLYVGVKYENAQTMEVSLNGKSTTVVLADGTCTGVGTAAVQNGSAEVFLPWAELGVALSDYYQEIPGFQVALIGTEQVTSSLKSSTSTLVITSEQVNEVEPNRMSTTGNKADLFADATKATWNTEAQGVSVFYQTGYNFVDHNKDLLFSQTLNFEKLPVSTGTFSGDLQANDSYYFWISDYADTGKDDGTKDNSGTAMMGAIYRADEAGNLYLRIYDGNTNKDTSGRINLGKKLGETFTLQIQWNANDSAVVFVDGEVVARLDNATVVKTQYMGSKAIQMRFFNVTAGNAAQFTVSDVSVSVASVASVLEEITTTALLPGVDLNNVQSDLNLPAVFASPYLGDIPLTWESSDSDVIDATTGEVTRPDSDESEVVQLSVSVDGEKLWTVDATVTPGPVEVLGPYPASPSIITTAFTAEEITIDGKPNEYGWLLNTRVLDAEGMQKGKFGAQWDKDTLYLVVKARGITTIGLNIDGKITTINVADLTNSGDFDISAIAKKNAYIEMSISMEELGLTLDGYDVKIPITVDLDGSTFTGKLKLTSIDWFAADNEYRPIPANTKGTVSLGVDKKVEGYQGYEQVTDGWRIYDLFNAEGENPSQIRTYVIFMKDALYEPMSDRSKTVYVEFDFVANALPIYDVTSDTGLTNHFASYGMTWFVADAADAAKNANTYSMGIINTEKGLALVGMPGTGVPTIAYLNREVGDLLRVGVAWRGNGDVVIYLDGEELVVWEGLEAVRGSFGDKSVAFNLIRNTNAATSVEDNLDVTITNVAMGHSYDGNVLEALTFETIAGQNDVENAIMVDLVLPDSLEDPIFDVDRDLTWTSSNEAVIDPNTGKVTRPASGEAKVVLTVTMEDGNSKTFELTVLGMSSDSGDVLVIKNDRYPANGVGTVTQIYSFTLDADNSSVIYDLKESQTVNVVALKDGDESARLNEEVLTLWVSDDNVTYTRVEDFKLLHKGDTWYLYDFEAEGRYVKVHCTHYDGEEADFVGSAAEMIRAYYQDVFGDGDSDFAVEKTYTLTNDTGKEHYDYAWYIAKADLGITGEDASIRVFAGEELLYHYVDGDNVIVRVPYVDKGASVTLTVLSGNDNAMDISNKEYVHEVTYGTREAWTISDGAHWILTLPAGTKFPDGSSVEEETMLILGGSNSMIWRAFSQDGGKSWSGKETIACTKEYITEGGGFIFDSVTGRIMFHGHKVVGYNANDLTKSDCKTNLIYSDDGGKTWQTLTTVQSDSKYLLSYTDGIQLSTYDGEGPNVDFAFPLGAQNNNSGGFCARVAYTTDGGKTWQTSEDQITYLEGRAHEGGVSESTIQEREDGVLVLIGRNQASGTDVFVEAFSYDHGVTWKEIDLSSIYTVNTQPIMFQYDGLPMLTWGGKNMLGDDSYIRTPYTIGVSYDGMETFDNLQDLYVKYSLQGLTYFNLNRVTNQSVQMTKDDTFVTVWWNSSKGWVESNTVFMYVEDFHDYFYRTKGAYDSFEHGTVRYEGWEASVGTATLADEKASGGEYSMKLVNAVAGRSIPYIQEGMISMDLYVDSTSDFTVELQSAFSNSYGKGAPVGFEVNGNNITFLGADYVSGLKLNDGWNTVTFALDLDGTGTVSRSNTASATLSVNGGEPVAMPVNLEIGDYVTWITIMNVGTTYVDEILVVDEQDAMDSEMLEKAEAEEETAKEAVANKAAADAVIAKINAIGEVTLSSLEQIEEARAAYNDLTEVQKELVTNYQVLTAAEEKLAELKEEAQETAANKAAAAPVIAKIDAIGEVTLNSEKAITEARAAFASLTDKQKACVTNYAKLVAAEKKLAELKAEQNKPGYSGSGNSGSGSNSGNGGSSNQSSGNQTTNAPTGDNANFTLPLMGILMSMIVMAGAIAVSKKKKNI